MSERLVFTKVFPIETSLSLQALQGDTWQMLTTSSCFVRQPDHPKMLGLGVSSWRCFFLKESFNMMPGILVTFITDEKLPPKHTPQHHEPKTNLVLQSCVCFFFFARKEAMDDSATMLGYPRLKAEVCCLETTFVNGQGGIDYLTGGYSYNLLHIFIYIILYYMHVICVYILIDLYFFILFCGFLLFYTDVQDCPKFLFFLILFFFYFPDFLALLHRFKDLSEGKNPCGYKVARSLGFVSKV